MEEAATPNEVVVEGIPQARLMNWSGWIDSFLTPSKAFRNNREGASFAGVAMNILAGLINAGIIALILVMATRLGGQDAGITGAFGYTTQFIIFLSIWLANSIISYSISMLAGGMGSLKQHLYLLSLPLPFSSLAFLLLATVLNLLFSAQIALGVIGAMIIIFYVVNMQITAVKEAQKFGFLQAVISAIIPLIAIGFVVGVLIFVIPRK